MSIFIVNCLLDSCVENVYTPKYLVQYLNKQLLSCMFTLNNKDKSNLMVLQQYKIFVILNLLYLFTLDHFYKI